MSSDEEGGGEMEEVLQLQKLKEAYGGAMSDAEHHRRLKAIQAKWAGKLGAKAGGKARAKFIWRDVRGKTAVVAEDFKGCRKHMPGDFKADPDCRSGILNNFKGNIECKFRRRMAIIDGKQTRYRIIALNNKKYCLQIGYEMGADGSSDDDSDDDKDGEEKEVEKPAAAPPAQPQPAAASARGKGGKNKSQEEPEAGEEPPASAAKRTRRAAKR